MKQTTIFKSVASVALAMLIVSCSNDESVTASGQLTAFTGGIVSETPITRVSFDAPYTSSQIFLPSTRTSMGRTEIGGKGTFFWEPNDNIYVRDDKGKFFKSQSNITGTSARFTFFVNGVYGGNSSYDVYYNGTNSGSDPKKVVIASEQTQTAFNDTKHFGASGDCGVAKALKKTGQGDSGYKFDLEHKASYICFLPYMATQEQRDNYKIQRIELTSDRNIAGSYELSQSGLSGEGTTNTITLTVGANSEGLLLGDKSVSTQNLANSLYMVVAPGTHTLTVKYTVFDTSSNRAFVITKKYGRRLFDANKIYDLSVGFSLTSFDGGHKVTDDSETIEEIRVYSGYDYYMWDAKENYWFGHEWDSADPWQPNPGGVNENYPRSKATDPARWYNDERGIPLEASTPRFQKLPNANELAWYVMKGDPHFDNETQWELMGKIYTGGIWFKKLSVIAKENNKTLEELKNRNPNGRDMRVQVADNVAWLSGGESKPVASEIHNYFFLPALAYCSYSVFSLYGGYAGRYWSSSAYPDPDVGGASYSLNFDSTGNLKVHYNYRFYGYVAMPFEE